MHIVTCDVPGCGEPATHKVASRWTDGRFTELKTYGFACTNHVGDICSEAEIRWLDYEPVPGESVGAIGIYHYQPGKTDRQFHRDYELEETYLACPPPV